jgi:hypothetical protein
MFTAQSFIDQDGCTLGLAHSLEGRCVLWHAEHRDLHELHPLCIYADLLSPRSGRIGMTMWLRRG